MALDRVPGPENKHASMTMGNSVEAWQKHYDLSYTLRDSQEGIEKTAIWRENMLVKSVEVGAAEGRSSDDIEVDLD